MPDDRYRCGNCGIVSDKTQWIFDWEDPVEETVFLICPHCGVRSSETLLRGDTDA